nr:AMP-binding protein [uncultured Lichenicoccus sp.]
MTSGWWHDRDALGRVLADLIAAEGRRLRLSLVLPPGPWGGATTLAALGFDSLDRIALAAAVSELLHLDESARERGGADDLLAQPQFGAWCDAAAAALDSRAVRLSFRTSGSTGAPRSCTHALADLEAEADEHAANLGESGGGGITRILAAVPGHHIYGFIFTVLLPHRLGVPVLDLRARSPGAIAGLARAGDLVVAYPDLWTAIVRASPGGWAAGVTGVTSTAPCPEATARALAGGGLRRLVEIHGASETAGVGWRDDPAAPYTLLARWQHADGGHLRRAGSPDIVEAPDRLDWCGPLAYRVGARRDGAVQVGGINVWPKRISDMLCGHPDVAAASVRLMDEMGGRRLKAFIVPAPHATDHDALRIALERLAAARLSAAEQPRDWRFGPALPEGVMGKAADW